VQELVRKGIPCDFRGKAWYLLSGAYESSLRDSYPKYLDMESPHEKYIRRDVCRTYPEHEMFKRKDGAGQESLFNVIKVVKPDYYSRIR
jgi:ecotropic viral integration site 5 protein